MKELGGSLKEDGYLQQKGEMPSRNTTAVHRLKQRLLRIVSLSKLWMMQLLHGLPSIGLENIVQENVEVDTPILQDICLPPYVGTNAHDDLVPLMKIAKRLRPQIVVELGTGYGNLTANICRQCPSTKVYTVNSLAEDQTGSCVSYMLELGEIGRVYRSYGFTDRVVQILENTLDLNLSQHFDGCVVDLAIIDACHDTDYVVNDFFKVQPFVRPHGIVLFHDTHPSMRGHLRGSYVACMRLRRQGYDISHIEGTWWAIWIKDGHRAD